MRRFFKLTVLIAPAFITLIVAVVWMRSYRAVDLFYIAKGSAISSSNGELVFISTWGPEPVESSLYSTGSDLFVQTGPGQITQIGTRTAIPYWVITLLTALLSITTFLTHPRSMRSNSLRTVGFEPVMLK
jgi:hypothetical protein